MNHEAIYNESGGRMSGHHRPAGAQPAGRRRVDRSEAGAVQHQDSRAAVSRLVALLAEGVDRNIVECDISDSWEQPSIAEIKRITNIYKRMTAHLEHIRFTVTAERPVTAYAVGALTGTAGRMTVILPGKIEPRPVKVAAYAGAAPGGIAARMTVPIHGAIRQKEIRVTGYAAAKTAATAMRLTAAINGKIEQRDITVRGFAAAKVTETVQRIEVKVKGGNT